MPDGWRSNSTSIISSSTSATTSPRPWSARTSPRTKPASRRTRASSATDTSSSTGCRSGRPCSASMPSPPGTTPAPSERTPGRWRLRRGADRAKDQSYVVHMLDQGALARTIFPVGHIAAKADLRADAARRGLRTATKPDSQDVCFITAGAGRQGFLARRTALHPARVVDTAGTPVGRVESIELVTIGQRKGLGLVGGGPKRYVVEVDRARSTVVVGDEADLLVDRVIGARRHLGRRAVHGRGVGAGRSPRRTPRRDDRVGRRRRDRRRAGGSVSVGSLQVRASCSSTPPTSTCSAAASPANAAAVGGVGHRSGRHRVGSERPGTPSCGWLCPAGVRVAVRTVRSPTR